MISKRVNAFENLNQENQVIFDISHVGFSCLTDPNFLCYPCLSLHFVICCLIQNYIYCEVYLMQLLEDKLFGICPCFE